VVAVTTRPAIVSVIMPTLARLERASSLIRAIDSVVSQDGARGIPLVVVNGPSATTEVKEHLARRRDIRVVTLEEAGLPLALKTGRATVDTSYFAVLDDDDELLPGALVTRLQALDEAAADVVVTNGYLQGFGRRVVNIEDFGEIQADPLRALLRRHWLPPCAGLFRTHAVTLDFFEAIPEYREWTYLGLRLALERKIHFMSRPTFVYRTDTPGSLSKSKASCLAESRAMARMLELPLPRDVRTTMRARLTAGLHSASDWERRDGNHLAAWRWHLRCLLRPRGWRYLPYTRHLLIGSLRRLPAAPITLGKCP
jgi:glycosyltransferase involved in cell wall biosynthesis